jgi:hypothetical protein
MKLTTLQRFGASVFHAASIKTKRNSLDVFADRVRQASVEPTLMAFGQRLSDLVDAQPSELRQQAITDFLALCTSPDGPGALKWIRENPTLYAVLCASKQADADAAMEGIELPKVDSVSDQALPRRPYHITIRAKCLTPLSHGSDTKSGNATLFRRMAVLGQSGTIMELPYYAGNAVRGQMRDLLADHFAVSLGLKPRRDNPPFALWFFHVLYAGGALEEASTATKAINSALGDNGAIRADGVREFRDTLPHLSLLGAAMGNRVLAGHADFGDLRPVCREWGNGGEVLASELFEWIYLTRREDHEDHDEHHGMIAVTETLKAGTVLEGGIDLRLHTSDLAKSALGVGLRLLQERGRLGAQNRADLGSVEIELTNAPDPEPYETYLRENKENILSYLEKIGGIHARDAFNF